MPYVVADCVLSEAERIFKLTFTPAERERHIERLVRHGEAVYAASPDFARKIQGRGNSGRDTLYVFNRHWLAAQLVGSTNIRHDYPSIFWRFANGEQL